MKLELYYFPSCPYCQKVLNKISDLDIKSVELKNIMENSDDRKKLLADTGRQTVPCLYIDGKPMHESDDINAWLTQNNSRL